MNRVSLKRPIVAGVLTSLYIYLLLPATSTFFYELYHLVNVEFVYWLYSGFKVVSVFLPRWEYFELTVVAGGVVVGGGITLWRIWRSHERLQTPSV